MAGFVVLAIRGGFQLKPLRMLQAVEAVGLNYAPLVLNSPFTILKMLNKESLQQKHYLDSTELNELYSPMSVLRIKEIRCEKRMWSS